MMTNQMTVEEPKPVLSVNKWKFITWLFIITIVMLFASQTSAYLVRRAEGNWTEFEMPQIFYWSTLVLMISSVFMFLARRSAAKDDFQKLKVNIALAFVLGLGFLVMQYIGWLQLQETGIYLKGNPSGSFLYILDRFTCLSPGEWLNCIGLCINSGIQTSYSCEEPGSK